MRASIFTPIIVAAVATLGSAQAATVSWDTSSGTGSSYVSSTGSTAGNEMTFKASTGEFLKARAFYIEGSSSGNTTGLLKNSALAMYDQGLGVTTTQSGECYGCSPEHAVDNVGLKELVVFQLPSDNWDPTTVHLVPFGSSMDTDVTFYVGGAAEFTNLGSFENKSLSYLLSHGFTTVDEVTDTTGERNVPVNTTPATGRYLIVAAWLGDTTPEDHFKIETVSAKPGGGTSVPEPGTLSLLTVGLCAVGAYRRRRPSSAA
jgi:hypothetical protein